jgi:hypothetical protein
MKKDEVDEEKCIQRSNMMEFSKQVSESQILKEIRDRRNIQLGGKKEMNEM